MPDDNKDLEEINKLHQEYFTLLSSNNMKKLKNIFNYPSVFKGFLDEIAIVNNGDELESVYKELIAKAPQADLDANITTSTSMKNSIPYKLRDDTYMIIMEYSQYTEDESEFFSGRAGYLFTKFDNKWKISGVF